MTRLAERETTRPNGGSGNRATDRNELGSWEDSRSARRPQVHVTLPMIRRMRELTAAGLSRGATAKVIALDFDCVPPSTGTVQKYAPDLPQDSPWHERQENLALGRP